MRREAFQRGVRARPSPAEERRRLYAKRVREFLERNGLESRAEVRVARRERWLVLDGIVESQRTKTALIQMAPRVDGAQWIIDRLRIVAAS